MRERIDYLNNLGQNRIHSLKFLKELTEVLPDTVWLSGLSVAGSKVEIQGYARAGGLAPFCQRKICFNHHPGQRWQAGIQD
jgi:Tfp pilus assembly protein PilN